MNADLVKWGTALGLALPKLVELWELAGRRTDAFLAGLDGALALARAKNDADLTAKHGGKP